MCQIADWITESFNEAVRSRQYIVAFKLHNNFDYFLDVNWKSIVPTILQALRQENFFYETKLQLIAKFV